MMNRSSLYNVMTDGNKTTLTNFRIALEDLLDFHAVADLRGATASGLLHQYIRQLVREEKQHAPAEFAKAREKARKKRDKRKSQKDGKTDSEQTGQEIKQSYLFSRGTDKPKSKRVSKREQQDIDEIKRDARERTQRKLQIKK